MTEALTQTEQVAARPFGPGDLLWDLGGDYRSYLVFLTPTLMQTMHPIIGDALARMPVAVNDPYGRFERSTDSIHLWIYGGEKANEERRRLIELHTAVRGRDVDGREYSALKPEVWAWVPLSGYPAFLTLCRVFGEPLPDADAERLYDEFKNLARILGVREQHIPPTTEAYWDYYHDMVDNRLIDHPYVHDVLDKGRQLSPPPVLPRPLKPLWMLIRPGLGAGATWLTHGTFPPEMRYILGIDWTTRDELMFRAVGQVIRGLSSVTPERLRYPKMPRLARAIARAQESGRSTDALQKQLDSHLALVESRNTKFL